VSGKFQSMVQHALNMVASGNTVLWCSHDGTYRMDATGIHRLETKESNATFIGWDFGSGRDVAVLGEWRDGVLHILDEVVRDTTVRPFQVGDRVRFKPEVKHGEPGIHRVTGHDAGGFPYLSCWPEISVAPQDLMTACVDIPEDTQMSDFKVGDVVVAKPNQEPIEALGNGRKCTVARAWIGDCYGHCSHHQYVTLEEDGRHWDAIRFLLVSRPSEAKSMKSGDRIVTNKGIHGVLLGDTDVPGFRWKVELPDHLTGLTCTTNLREHEVMPVPVSAFKVGDRVRVRGEGTGRIAGPHDKSGHWVHMDGDPRPGSVYYLNDSLELLTPEPASIRVDPLGANFRGFADKYLAPGAPMTATAASILANNQTDPMRDPEYTHELDMLRYMIQNTLPATRSIYDAVVKPPETMTFIRYERQSPGPLIEDGWMPAGTYMPLKDGAKAGTLGCSSEYHYVRYKRMDIPLGSPLEDPNKGIAKSIPSYERRFSSRTQAWDPMDDTFLEDE